MNAKAVMKVGAGAWPVAQAYHPGDLTAHLDISQGDPS